MKKIINFSIALIAFLLTLACMKEGFNNPTNADAPSSITVRSSDDNQFALEPDYSAGTGILFEYLSNLQGVYAFENYAFPESYAPVFRVKHDSIMNIYKDVPFEDMIATMAQESMISQELADAVIGVHEGIPDISTAIEYLEEQFTSADLLSLSKKDLIYLKSFIAAQKGYYLYANLLLNSYSDSSNVFQIQTREREDCVFDMDNVKDMLKETVYWSGKGAFIGGLIGGQYGAGVGAGIGAVVGAGLGLHDQIELSAWCKECIIRSISRELTGLCDDAAWFTANGGVNSLRAYWKNQNGIPKSAVTAFGERLLIKQIDGSNNLLNIVQPECIKDDNTTEKINFTFIKQSNIITDQTKVPDGSLIFHGRTSIDDFPEPQSSSYSDYVAEITTVYDLTGLVFERPELELAGLAPLASNVKDASINGKKLTVTWKVDEAHWDEFYNSTQTIGTIGLKVQNTCKGGDSRVFILHAALIYYDDLH